MMEEDFYATLKLKTGEEIFAKVCVSEEEDKTLLLVSHPVIIREHKSRISGNEGYKLESWLKTTTDDMFIINLEDVLTMSESSDVEMISMYQGYVRKYSNVKGNKSQSESKLNRKMGYIANVNDAKEILEKLYKKS